MGNTLKLENFALTILVFFMVLKTVAASVINQNLITEPQREVVSIYNDTDFTTPESRYPYFIEVHRCVKVDGIMYFKLCDSHKYPVQANMTEIEIVVPDLTNNERDPSKENKFYKYIVFNHTSCKCGQLKERTLNGTSSNKRVSKDYFLKKYNSNPKNLRTQPDYCSKARRRYKLHPKHVNAIPMYKYLEYKQCMPGCVVKKNVTNTIITALGSSDEMKVSLTSDTECVAYDNEMENPTPCLDSVKASDELENSHDEEKKAELLIYVESGKIFLAAGLLSLILLTILIMDFTLCRRKKGFVYALFSCGKDNACEHCTQRFLNQTTI